ncbi:hypothetical protein [Streptomyces sp. KAU_LT]|uniref:hypothetical protein n=1 Tax=Streptomyces sp. KAU_LT TaxID=3046669 RepID=UPI0024B65966|nr:hypothetical protein [Streptomyces sp. KAU_LT]MDI9836226.1 hypothetical protein [Streptomyces sp. KAU_LT]
MPDTTDTETESAFQLPTERVSEIRDLLAELVALATPRTKATSAADIEHREHLARCRDAIADLLNDRDSLVAASAAAGEELATWRGAL